MNDIDPKSEREPGDEQRTARPVHADAGSSNAGGTPVEPSLPSPAERAATEPSHAEPAQPVSAEVGREAAPIVPSPAAINPSELGPIVATPIATAASASEAPAQETAAAESSAHQVPAVEIEPQPEGVPAGAEASQPAPDAFEQSSSLPPVPPSPPPSTPLSSPHPSQGPIIIPVSAKEALRPTPVPEPPQRLKKSRGSRSQVVVFLNFVMTVLVFLTIALGGAIYYGLSTFSEQGPSTVNSNFIVKPGWGLGDISRGLEASGLISDARVFQYVTKSFLRNRTLKAGEYEIKAGASMKEIVELMESGKSILYSVTLPEGLTVQQVFDRLRADTVLEGDLPAKMPDEGTLRPDTYKFTRGAKRGEIVAQMKAAQAKLVEDLWAKRSPDLFIKTKEQFVTLASIVEKETGKADERTLVASVFLNRLEKKMRLQSDPTVIYGIFGGAGKPSDRPIYQSDLKKMTPYNTYVVDGLPPGPICNPGRAALEAVANPSKTSDLYFVADGTGGHVFAATLEEHNANVKKWRQVEDQQTNPTGTDAGATATQPTPQQ